jgi:two-component system cell cycle sensor histidine kinase/response regulator CckA
MDPGQLEQVVVNLAVNARDAMPGGGRLTIIAERWSAEPFPNGSPVQEPVDHAMITVRDTGQGMDAAVQARIFEPFFTTKAPGKGTGLGLSMAWGIIHQAKGCIQVESQPGAGTTIRIYLPLATQGQTSRVRRPISGRVTSGSGETILLVEDEGAIRELETDLLQALGYRVLTASNGEEALTVAGAGQPFVAVVTDLVMPRLGGEALVARLRQSRPRLRALLTSGYPENIAMREGGLEDHTSFLQKPFAPAELARALRQLLDAPGERG